MLVKLTDQLIYRLWSIGVLLLLFTSLLTGEKLSLHANAQTILIQSPKMTNNFLILKQLTLNPIPKETKNLPTISKELHSQHQSVSRGTRVSQPHSLSEVTSLPMPTKGRISSLFGKRWGKNHNGIDFAVPKGSPVHAVFHGTVIFSGVQRGYGRIIILSHPDGYSTYYAHNEELKVTVGSEVRQGDLIALSGSTGRSTGPHLHFEIRKDDVPINPISFLQ